MAVELAPEGLGDLSAESPRGIASAPINSAMIPTATVMNRFVRGFSSGGMKNDANAAAAAASQRCDSEDEPER
jgi:hypothetical protein